MGIEDERGVEQLRRLGRYVFIRRTITLACVTCSAFLQAFTIQTFVNPANLLSGGFTGLAILIDRITSLVGVTFPTQLGMITLNIPVAILCWRSISKRFVIFSMLQVFLASATLQFVHFEPLLDNTLLCVLFGGVLNGIAISIALKAGASTAGTDFIALMVTNRTGHTIWQYVFLFNCIVLAVFGFIFGWDYAAYSIIFQFISTKAIDSFYHRYERVTLQIATEHANEVLSAYNETFHHGSTVFDAHGGYSGRPIRFIVTVVSSYETDDIIRLVRHVDARAVINVTKTENFIGNFHRAPADEPLPTEVDGTPEDDPVVVAAQSMRRGVEQLAENRRAHSISQVRPSTDELKRDLGEAVEHIGRFGAGQAHASDTSSGDVPNAAAGAADRAPRTSCMADMKECDEHR